MVVAKGVSRTRPLAVFRSLFPVRGSVRVPEGASGGGADLVGTAEQRTGTGLTFIMAAHGA